LNKRSYYVTPRRYSKAVCLGYAKKVFCKSLLQLWCQHYLFLIFNLAFWRCRRY